MGVGGVWGNDFSGMKTASKQNAYLDELAWMG
jgi:hypothetical protein